jgi:hypothetical protein
MKIIRHCNTNKKKKTLGELNVQNPTEAKVREGEAYNV